LDGDGIETLGKDSGIYFDHEGNGFAQSTGWVGSDDGLLVFDKNSNGIIDDGNELFGNNTLLANGSKAANGFTALADLDTNADGVIDSEDTAFGNLRVWRDLDGNGRVSEGELFALEALGIQSLNTQYTSQNITDAQGNKHLQTGSYTLVDGTTRAMNDVWFTEDTARTVDMNPVEIPEEITALPDISAFGNVHSLHQAMARDESGTLQSLVESFVSETDPAARTILISQIIYAWVGVADIAPNSRGTFFDARKLAVLENFLGTTYMDNGSNVQGPNAVSLLTKAFDALTDYVGTQLMLQTHLAPLLESSLKASS